MARRSILVEDICDYSDEEIEKMQKFLDDSESEVVVFKDITPSSTVGLYAAANIFLNTEEVIFLVGDSYIEGVHGEHSI